MKTRCILFFILLLGATAAKAQIFTDSRRTFSYTDDSTVMPGDVKVLEILFDFNGACRIFEEYHDSLNLLAEYLLRHPNIQVLISVHVDARGSNKSNQILSECRAKRVEQYLQQRKVPQAQYSVVGKGEEEPLITEETIAAEPAEATRERYHKMNRRTEVKIISITNP